MKLNSIASRVFFGVFTIILVLCGIVGINMSQHTDINHYSKQSFNQEVPATQLSLNIKYQLAKALEALRGWSSIGDYFYKQDFFAAWQEINRLKDEFMLLQNTDAATVNELSSKLSQLQQAQLRVLDTAQTPENFPGLQMLKVEMEPKVKRLVSLSTELIETESAKPEGVRSYELVKQLADFRFSITTAMSSLRIYLLTKNEAFRIQYQSQWHRNGLSFAKLWRMESLFTMRQRDLMEELESFRQAFEAIPEQVVQLRMSDEWDVAEYSIANNIAELDREAANFIEGIYLNSRKRMFSNLENIKKSQDEALNISVVSLVVGIIICLIITALLTRMIAGPIEQVVSIANNISKGKFDVDTDIKGADEVMLLSTSLSNMLQMLRDVALHTRQVADGNFDSEFLPRGEDDQLGNSLQVMTDNLRKTTKYNQLQDWSKTGVAHFTESLQGLTDIEKILPELMNFTGRYFDAQVGALYLLRGGKLVLSASYAYKHRNNLDSEYQLGEGFIGQAALERKSIVFSHLGHDEGQLKIDTGLGLVSPNHIVVSPLIDPQSDEQSFVGVLVLGAEQAFNQIQLETVEKIAENAAITIEMANSRFQLQSLLEASQSQAEELQAQQEELRVANEELEQQTQRLKKTQEEQAIQSQHLEKSNQALQEKTDLLEEQKRALEVKNREVEEAKRQVELTAQKVAQASKYKSEFLSNMSHELRTPLNSLLILSENLITNEFNNLNSEQVEDMKIIHSGGQTLLALINDILDLAKVESGKLTVVADNLHISELAQRIRFQFKPVAEKQGVDLIIDLQPDLPETVRVDSHRLEQILRNLLSNAFKFTEQGEVELKVGTSSAPSLLKQIEQSGGIDYDKALVFQVRDTGIGIAPGVQDDIFEAFRQADGSTSRKFGGTGLGLTISRELSQLLGGSISLQSTPNLGSTFTLAIPLKLAEEEGVMSEGAQVYASYIEPEVESRSEQVELVSDMEESRHDFVADDRQGVKAQDPNVVLIVDDDPAFVQSMIKLAHGRGFKCIATDLGKQALSLALQYPISAIILDLGLPDISGDKVLMGLKASPDTRGIPVHIISAQDEDDAQLDDGAIGFLTKPVSLESIKQVFARFERNKKIRKILLLEDDQESCYALKKLLAKRDIEITATEFGQEAISLLQANHFECVILDLTLTDMNGLEWLKICEEAKLGLPPVVIYSGEELTEDKYKALLKYTNSFVVKGGQSSDRLLDEITLFLASANKPLAQQSVAPSNQISAFDGKKVLVVDDDLRNTYALSKVLKSQGLKIVIADNGQMAIDKLQEEQDFHLILMDIMMPIMDGYEAIKQIRSKYGKDYPIIALTAKAMAEDREQCLNAGANDYLTKPVETQKLVEMVRVWLE